MIKTDAYKSLFDEFALPSNFIPLRPLCDSEDEFSKPIIQGYLYENTYVLLHGAKESYKSWLAAYMAVCVATGTSFFNHEIKKPGKVVYIYGEGSMKKRLKSLCRGMNIPIPDTLYAYNLKTDLTNVEAQADLKRHIPEGTVAIIIDNYEKFWSSHTEEQIVSSAVRFLQSIASKAAIILVQHQPKGARSKRVHDLAIGSVRIVNAADSTFALKRSGPVVVSEIYHREAEAPVSLEFELEKLGEDKFRLKLNTGLRAHKTPNTNPNEDLIKLCRHQLKQVMSGHHSKTAIYSNFLCRNNIKGLSSDNFYKIVVPQLIGEGTLIQSGETRKYELQQSNF